MSEPWDWMWDVDQEDYFLDYDEEAAAKSSDFGSDGYTASLTNWHELLQLTAPDPQCGLISVRGDFPVSGDAILARAQNRDQAGGKGTFGIQLLQGPDSDFQLGSLMARGLINYRWPHMQYELSGPHISSGSFETCSFVDNEVMYQIARIRWVAAGGPIDLPPADQAAPTSLKKTARFRIGGRVGFGCVCTRTKAGIPLQQYRVQQMADNMSLSCCATNPYCQVQGGKCSYLNMRLHVNNQKRKITVSPNYNSENDVGVRQWVDISDEQHVDVKADEECVLILAFHLSGGVVPKFMEIAPSSEDVKKIVGVTNALGNQTGRMWRAHANKEYENFGYDDDRHCIARCVEYICSVTAIPIMLERDMTQDQNNDLTSGVPGQPPSQQEKNGMPSIRNSSAPPLRTPTCDSNLEPLKLLAHPLVSQDNQNVTHDSITRRSTPLSEQGQEPPSRVELPASTTSSLNAKDAVPDENQISQTKAGDAKRISSLEGQIGYALVHNIFFGQFVRLESMFWQIRLLVKVNQFLKLQLGKLSTNDIPENESGEDGHFKEVTRTYERYQSRLQAIITGALRWMVNLHEKADKPSSSKRKWSPEIPINVRPVSNQKFRLFRVKYQRLLHQAEGESWLSVHNPSCQTACFGTMIMHYILKVYPEIPQEEFQSPWLQTSASDLSIERAPREIDHKTAMLRWYHYTCLYHLIRKFQISTAFTESQKSHVRQLEHAAMRLTRPIQKSRPDLYTAEDEQTDRLLLLYRELALEPNSANASITHVLEKIKSREPTTTINPGWRTSKSTSSVDAPWEFSCLNHHTAFDMAMGSSDSDINKTKDACLDFHSTDYTFLPTWDRSKRDMSERWWDMDASSIVCATLLDHNTGVGDKQYLTDPIIQSVQETPASLRRSDAKPFEWNKSISSTVFGDEWVQSLEDTPEIFRNSQTKDVGLRRALREYLREFQDSKWLSYEEPPSYSIEDIDKLIPAQDLLYLSLFDFTTDEDGDIELDYDWSRSQLNNARAEFFDRIGAFDDEACRQELWEWAIDGLPWESFNFSRFLAKDKEAKLRSPNLRQECFEGHQTEGLRRLSDSMVDLGVRYRILLAQRCSPSVVQAFIYMWHPRAIDTFDCYFGSFTSFDDSKDGDNWITTITFNHWILEPASYMFRPKSKAAPKSRYTEPRQRSEFPPPNVKLLQQPAQRKFFNFARNTDDFIEERSTALVITGDLHGNLWTCSIWSCLIDDEALPTRDIVRLLTVFKHQQSSGRILVFLLILGIICEKLDSQYEESMRSLKSYVELGPKVFLEGYDGEAGDAVNKLKVMLWGLEALRIFDNRLSSSIDNISDAFGTLKGLLDKEPGERLGELNETCRKIVEECGKKLDFLLGNQRRIKLKIEQMTGLRDGISTITNVEDSHIAIKQGNNIRVLTYITIAYLPVGFITALFSTNHNILPDNAGTLLFAVLVSVCFLGTYALAFSLESIIGQIQNVQKGWNDSRSKISGRNTEPKEDATSRSSGGEVPSRKVGLIGGFFGLRRRHGNSTNNLDSAEKATSQDPTEALQGGD